MGEKEEEEEREEWNWINKVESDQVKDDGDFHFPFQFYSARDAIWDSLNQSARCPLAGPAGN